MDVLLVSGFLGAGKTTLIKHLLTSEIGWIGKVAVIVNEVGEVGIDGTLLSGQNVDMVELTSGCICCTIQTDFIKAVQEIRDRVDPDFLVVEATGVAQPGDMFDILFYSPLSDFTALKNMVTVVDADFFKAREVLGTFYNNQIRFSDTLILNKVDLVKPSLLSEIEGLLRETNPGARILTAKYCKVDPSRLFHGYSQVRKEPHHEHAGHHDHHEWGFQSFSFKDERPMDKRGLETFMESLPSNLFRLKGWVRFPDSSAFLDFAGGRYRLEPVDKPRTTALTFVGKNCNETEILNSLRNCLEKK